MAAAFVAESPAFDAVPAPAPAVSPEARGGLDGHVDALYQRLRGELGSEEHARDLTAEVMTRVAEHPLWALSVRHGLPLGPLVRECADSLLAECELEV